MICICESVLACVRAHVRLRVYTHTHVCVCVCVRAYAAWADNFVAETSREHDAAEQMKIEDSRKLANMSHVLDPVFKVIATDYVDEVLKRVWGVMVALRMDCTRVQDMCVCAASVG